MAATRRPVSAPCPIDQVIRKTHLTNLGLMDFEHDTLRARFSGNADAVQVHLAHGNHAAAQAARSFFQSQSSQIAFAMGWPKLATHLDTTPQGNACSSIYRACLTMTERRGL